MRLVWISGPAVESFESLSLEISPLSFLDHELPGDFVPSFFPIEPGVKDHDCNLIDSNIASDECKPIAFSHGPKFILILYESIVIKLIFIERSLFVEPHLILGTQFVHWNHISRTSFHFERSLHFAFEGRDEETV